MRNERQHDQGGHQELRRSEQRGDREQRLRALDVSHLRNARRRPHRGDGEGQPRVCESDPEVDVQGADRTGDQGSGDATERVRRMHPLQHGLARPRLRSLCGDVEVDVDQPVADPHEREGEQDPRGRQVAHRERPRAQQPQRERDGRGQRERLEPWCDQQHHADGDEGEQRVVDADPRVADVVESLELEHQDDPHAPVLAERPIAGEQRPDLSTGGRLAGRRRWGARRLAHRRIIPPGRGRPELDPWPRARDMLRGRWPGERCSSSI